MKISIKTIVGNQFDLQVAEDELVSSVKAKIEENQGKDVFPCAQQCLILHDKDLKDETTMADNEVSEGEFLIVKLKETNLALAGSPASSSGSSEAPPAPPAPSLAAPETTPAPPASPAPDDMGQLPRGAYDPQSITPEERGSIERLEAMGVFNREIVIEAFLACNREEERAANCLFSVYFFGLDM